jgi:hypothetical protein
VEVAKKYQKELPRIKNNIEKAQRYFADNCKTFHWFNNFVFNTTLSQAEKSVLNELDKPVIEFNICEAYISRLLGEFDKHEPAIEVSANPGYKVNPEVIEFVENHLRYKLMQANKDGFSSELMKDLTGGGFGVIKITTSYLSPMSFEQDINFEHIADPTNVWFDPDARKPHKGDGKFVVETYRKTLEEIKDEFGNIDLRKLKQSAGNGGKFRWKYKDGKEEVIVLCDYYEIKKKKVKLYELATGHTVTQPQYEELMREWEEGGYIEQPPAVTRVRMTDFKTLCRYVLIESEILAYEETDFNGLNYIFGDGNSRLLREPTADGDKGFGKFSELKQKTLPYAHNLVGVQRLKNLAGQTLANELELITQQKFAIAEEAIPDQEDFQRGITDPQKPGPIITKAYMDDAGTIPLPPVQQLGRTEIPAVIPNTFMMADQTSQQLLGSYDAEMGVHNKDLSGKAMFYGSLNSNAASKAPLKGFLTAQTMACQIYVDLLPKYVKTPRTIPIIRKDGKRDFVTVNDGQGPQLNYEENALHINIEAGPSFALQKAMAVQELTTLSQTSPLFAEFINTKGLEVVLDNIEIRGIDHLKELAQEFMKELEQRKAAQMQQAQQAAQNNPMLIKAQNERMKIMQQQQKDQVDAQLEAAHIAIDNEKVQNERLEILADIDMAQTQAAVRADEAYSERVRAAVDMAIKAADMSHKHTKETHELNHMVRQAAKDNDKGVEGGVS